MDWKLFAQLVVTFLVAAAGWWVAHAFTSRRDVANERRKQRLAYLLDAYRRLESCTHRDNIDFWPVLESAMADIQLLGSAKQVALIQQVARDIEEDPNQGVPLDDLLFDIRQSLRAELGLEVIKTPVSVIRFRLKK